jgi:hypothetical protein
MISRRSLSLLALAFAAGVVVALGGFFLFDRDSATAAGPGFGYGMMGSGNGPGMMGNGNGPGMMGSGSGGMMGGAFGATVQTTVTATELAAVRDRVEKQLASAGYEGFTVGEIMAFDDNDYLLVEDASGKPAFELLADPNGRWLMPEPQSAMWNTSYGMMRGFSGDGYGMMGGYERPSANGSAAKPGAPVTEAQAKTRADAWLAQHRPGETTADATALPGYFTIDVTKNGAKVGMLSLNRKTGAVWYHTWHGSFLADQDF